MTICRFDAYPCPVKDHYTPDMIGLPISAYCPSSAPYLCPDHSCHLSINDCNLSTSCPFYQVLCNDGTCKDHYEECNNPVVCPSSKPYRCFDNICVSNPQDCNSNVICPADRPYRCYDNICTDNQQECHSLSRCRSNLLPSTRLGSTKELMCFNYQCYDNSGYDDNELSNIYLLPVSTSTICDTLTPLTCPQGFVCFPPLLSHVGVDPLQEWSLCDISRVLWRREMSTAHTLPLQRWFLCHLSGVLSWDVLLPRSLSLLWSWYPSGRVQTCLLRRHLRQLLLWRQSLPSLHSDDHVWEGPHPLCRWYLQKQGELHQRGWLSIWIALQMYQWRVCLGYILSLLFDAVDMSLCINRYPCPLGYYRCDNGRCVTSYLFCTTHFLSHAQCFNSYGNSDFSKSIELPILCADNTCVSTFSQVCSFCCSLIV